MSDTDDDAALAAAEALADAWHPDDKHVIRAIREPVAIARRALRENRELREKLERVCGLERYDVKAEFGVANAYKGGYQFVMVRDLEAAIADEGKGTP